MQEYRIIGLGTDGRVKRQSEFLAPNDQVALESARRHIGRDDDVEVWTLEIVLAKLKPAAP